MNLSQSHPVVSIGLPVYNGEKYLKVALDSLIGQSFHDFEIIIADNASTDSTEEICRSYVAADRRVTYLKNSENIGAARNHNKVFEHARGKYFMWAAYDDVYMPDLILKEVNALETNPLAVLCYPIFMKIDEHDRVVSNLHIDRGKSSRVHQRFRSLIQLEHTCEQMYGLIRTEVLRQTDLHGSYTDSDRTLLSELSLYGEFYDIGEPLFKHRVHPESSTRVYSDWRERMLWFDPSLKGHVVFPHWMQCFRYFKIIARAPLTSSERFRCYLEMVMWLLKYGRGLVKDVLVALWTIVRKVLSRVGFKGRSSSS